jgi:hypothetical protein
MVTSLGSGSGMHKDELIQLHSLLSQVKRYLETENAAQEGFAEYRRLGREPGIERSRDTVTEVPWSSLSAVSSREAGS